MLIAICDDDITFCHKLKEYISEFLSSYHLNDTEIHTFESGEALLASQHIYDMAFLDVEMKGLSGIYTGKELKLRNQNIIFFIITAYDDYLDEALRFEAFRYLPKPLDKNRLYRNMRDALYLYNTRNKKVAIETRDAIYTMASSDIIMVKTENRKVTLHTLQGNFISIHNLTYWINTLEQPPFFQSHKSYIVNLEHIVSFDNSTIHLTENYIAYLTLRKYNEFRRTYLKYLDLTS